MGMKREIELKFFVDDLAPIRRALLQVGAVKSWAGVEKDLFFDTKPGTFKKTRQTLRIRDAGGKTLLTYKEHKSEKGAKICDEYQLEIKDAKEVTRIFERLGFRIEGKYIKPKREYWDLPKVAITLDEYPFGKFIEIEASEKKIKETAKKLNLDFSRTSTKSYRQLLEEHKNS